MTILKSIYMKLLIKFEVKLIGNIGIQFRI